MKEESKSVLKFNQRIFFTSQRIISLLLHKRPIEFWKQKFLIQL